MHYIHVLHFFIEMINVFLNKIFYQQKTFNNCKMQINKYMKTLNIIFSHVLVWGQILTIN